MSQCGPTDKRCTASTSDTSRSRTRIVPAGSNSQGQEHPFEGSSTHSNHLLSRRSLPPSRPDSNRTRAGAEQFRVPDHSAAGLHARGAIQGEVRDASDLVFHCASALTTKVRADQAARVLPIVDVSRLGLWLARGVVRRGDRGGMRSRCASAGGRAGGGSARPWFGWFELFNTNLRCERTGCRGSHGSSRHQDGPRESSSTQPGHCPPISVCGPHPTSCRHQIVGGGPAADVSDDGAAGGPHDPGGCVPQRPAQPFRFGRLARPVTAQLLERPLRWTLVTQWGTRLRRWW